MKRTGWQIAAIIVLVAAAGAAWWLHDQQDTQLHPGKGELAANWYGTSRGRMDLPAQLHWCPVTHVALLEAISGDSGMAVVFFERDALASGTHQVVNAQVGATAPRPAATAAMRWLRLARDTAVVGMRSESGTATLRIGSGLASGDLTFRVHSVFGADTAVVHARFRDVPVVTTATGCT